MRKTELAGHVVALLVIALPMSAQRGSVVSPEVRSHIERLEAKSAIARAEAARALAAIGPRAEAAVQPLVRLLGDRTPLTWGMFGGRTAPGNQAAFALAKLGRAGKNALAAAAGSEAEQVRASAVSA